MIYVCYYFSLKRQYPPLSMLNLQKMIDTNRIDTTKPIDLVAILNTGLYKMFPDQRHFGVNLTDEGADIFNAKINLEVQWASELIIAAVEKNGGVITTAYYDPHSLQAMLNTKKFFERGNLQFYYYKALIVIRINFNILMVMMDSGAMNNF